jgi:CSLREA domain-containing protein
MRRRFIMGFALAVVTGIVVVGMPQAAFAGTINVTTTADEFTNPGPETGCSLREAIRSANDDINFGGCTGATPGHDTINVPAGTYLITRAPDGTAGGDLDIEEDVTIAGAGAPTTVIDGNQLDRVMDIPFAGFSVTISGVTVRNGQISGVGGGIKNIAALTLQNVVVSANGSTGDGGGVSSSGAGATLTITNSTISGNHSDLNGGGVANSAGTATLANVTISGNTANRNGGGIWNAGGGTLSLNNVTVARNTANQDAAPPAGDGGGIATDGATVNIGNTIVGGNDDASPSAGAKEPDCFGTLTSGGYNLISDTTDCNITGSNAGNITDQNAGLEALADNGGPTPTHALKNTSPAVNSGSPAAPGSGGTACESTDQRGVARPQGPRCDIGSFELQGAAAGAKCLGVRVTLTGTSGPDILNGTNKRDGIEALGGNDSIKAQGGKDGICAGDGKDVAKGGTGNDKITGQGGNDRAIGGGGADLVKGGGGNDRLRGKKKDDTLRGGGGNDRLNGGPGFDVCKGGPGRDRFRSCEERSG